VECRLQTRREFSKRHAALVVVIALALGWNTRPGRELRGKLQFGVDALTGKQVVDIGQLSRREILQRTLAFAMRRYEAMHGEAARDLDDLVRDGLLQSVHLNDEWGRPLVVEPHAGGFVLRSCGADGAAGTADDWTLGGPESREP
jgi:hypothetical protein